MWRAPFGQCMTSPHELLIPYGATRLSPRYFDVVHDAEGRERVRCRIAHVLVQPLRREPLRLSDAGRLVKGPAAVQHRERDQVSELRRGFEDLCGLWWPTGRRFVVEYFRFVASQIDRHRSELAARLCSFGGLYRVRDWMYSAPAPLPRAWIPVPETREAAPDPEAHVACDFAFWTGDAIVALYVTGVETVTPARLRDIERLRRIGVQVVEVSASAMTARGPRVLRDRLPEAFLRFWDGERYPSGPSWTGMAGETWAWRLEAALRTQSRDPRPPSR